MSTRPRLSVVLPVRNATRWLDESVESLLGQSFADFEVIAVDDGSTDGSAEALGRWQTLDPRVRLIRDQAPGGPGDLVRALERGRTLARGTFVARMDADDLAPADRFAAQVELLETRPDVVLCGTPVRVEPRDGMTDGARAYEAWLNECSDTSAIERDLFVECPLAHPTFCMRADAVDAAGGYRSGPFPEDYDLVLRLWATGGRLDQAPCDPLVWRDHPDRLQRVDARYGLDAFRALKVEAWLSHDPGAARPLIVWGAGPTGKALARELIARGRQPEAFVDLDPRKIGQTIHGAEVLSPAQVGGPQGRFCLTAVSGAPARAEIRSELANLGWLEMADFRAFA